VPPATIDVDDNATALTTLRCLAGTCLVKRTVTTLEVGGVGRVTVGNPDKGATTVNVWSGALDWRGRGIQTLNWYGGAIDLRNAPKSLTINTLNVYPSVQAGLTRSTFGTVSATTTNYIAGGPVQGS